MKIFFKSGLYVFSFVFILQLLDEKLVAQAPSWSWARTAGSSAWDFAGGVDYNSSTISTDASGNSYVTGLFNGTATFGTLTISSPGHTGVFVARYDVNGNCTWVKKFGGNDADIYGNEGKSIDIDAAGNCYVTGVFHGSPGFVIPFGSGALTCTGQREIFIVKYDASGNELWAKQPSNTNTSNNYAKSIATDASGNSYITGYLGGGTNTFGSTPSLSGPGAFVIKYDASGNALWAAKIGSGSADGLCIDIDNSGNAFVSGYLQGTESFQTSPVTTLTSIGNRDVFLAKVASSGALAWVKHFGGVSSGPMTNYSYGKGIATDGSGNVFLTGDFTSKLVIGTLTLSSIGTSGSEAFVAKFDPNGNTLWAQQSTNSSSSGGITYGTSVKANTAGDCFFTGYYYPAMIGTETFCGITFPTVGNQIAYVLKINTGGSFAWGQFSSGSGSSSIPVGISLDAVNNVYIAGNNQGTQVFGTNTITSYGGYDVLVAKLNSATTSTLTTSVSELEKVVNLTIYPNPFNTSVSINLSGYEGQGTLDLKIYDVLGKEVRSFTNLANQSFSFSRGDLAKGIYSYKLSENAKLIKSGKLVAE